MKKNKMCPKWLLDAMAKGEGVMCWIEKEHIHKAVITGYNIESCTYCANTINYDDMGNESKGVVYYYYAEPCDTTIDDKPMNDPTTSSSPCDTISAVCDAMKSLLLYKNEKYGNSALEPVGIFFQNKPEESGSAGILIRLDDKLGRIKNRDKLRVNDLSDMIGYLTLLLASMSEKEDVIAEMNKQKD